jgi:hypothetical protein|tara:strand:+ start:40 stop:405 length:366 start_codon:yes stop_codon:yes gene_type:complete
MGPLAKEALKLFYKKFGRRILKTAADNKWVTNMIQTLKDKGAKVADTVRAGLKKDKPLQKPKIVPKTPRPFPGWKPRVIQGGKSKKPITAEDIIKKGDWDPSGMKGGGSVDKALPKRSRDI